MCVHLKTSKFSSKFSRFFNWTFKFSKFFIFLVFSIFSNFSTKIFLKLSPPYHGTCNCTQQLLVQWWQLKVLNFYFAPSLGHQAPSVVHCIPLKISHTKRQHKAGNKSRKFQWPNRWSKSELKRIKLQGRRWLSWWPGRSWREQPLCAFAGNWK